MHKVKRYGWIKDRLDARDVSFKSIHPLMETFPSSIDLRDQCPSVYDQGELGSCTANALAGNVQYIHPDLTPSRLFIYYDERHIEHTINSDSGAQIRDGIKSLVKQGVCQEELWPYDINAFAVKPPLHCYQEAKKGLISRYVRLTNHIDELKTCLVLRFPFVMGISVYESFEGTEVAKSGIVPMPGEDEEPLGGHAVMVVGYDDMEDHFIVRNSWGPDWGLKGYFFLPYAYVTNPNLTSDIWSIRQ